jgi:hypothetical protein
MDDFDSSQKTLPVFINSRDRLACLQKLLAWLERVPYVKPIILDNQSSFPPLLEFYQTLKHDVLFLGENLGKFALYERHWHSRELQLPWQYDGDYYVYTDSDVVPDDECPLDLFSMLKKIFVVKPDLYKIGPGIRIDDVPAWTPVPGMIEQEKLYWWTTESAAVEGSPQLFRATIDTTMALYDKHRWQGGENRDWPAPHHGFAQSPAIRLGKPYVIRHLPYYLDPTQMTEEDKFYAVHATNFSSMYSSHWWTRYIRPPAPPAW